MRCDSTGSNKETIMSILYVLIPLALILLGVAVWAFFWAVGSGQFDDLDTPAVRIVMDDDTKPDQDES
jgi:cbb3-type cytochrome oxidase maturation protein